MSRGRKPKLLSDKAINKRLNLCFNMNKIGDKAVYDYLFEQSKKHAATGIVVSAVLAYFSAEQNNKTLPNINAASLNQAILANTPINATNIEQYAANGQAKAQPISDNEIKSEDETHDDVDLSAFDTLFDLYGN